MKVIKPYIIPGLIVVILILCFGWLRSCERTKEVVQTFDHTAFRARIDKLVADSVSAQAVVDSILSKRAVDAEKFRVSQIALKREIKVRDIKLSEARQEIAALIDSIPQVKRYVDLADSTIAKRDEAIEGLELRLDASEVSHLEEVAALGVKHVAAVELAKEYETKIAETQSKLRKAERRRVFWKSATLVMTGAVAVLLLSN